VEAVIRRQGEVNSEDREVEIEQYVPRSLRRVQQMRRDLWPSIWMSFVSIIILAAALAILAYRMGTQCCH
jgi:hypothetical protein